LAFMKTGAGVSEVEQLLFYSIPGGLLLLLVGFFFVLHQPASITTGMVAGGVASAIPIGFLLFQAYTANALWVYELCNRRAKQQCLLPIQREFKKQWQKSDSDQVYHLSKRVLTVITNKDQEIGPYILRLVAIINARGVSLFATIVAACAPLLYLFTPNFWPLACWPLRLLAYYVVLCLVAVSLYAGIPEVRGQVDAYQELIVANNMKAIRELIAEFVKSRTSSK